MTGLKVLPGTPAYRAVRSILVDLLRVHEGSAQAVGREVGRVGPTITTWIRRFQITEADGVPPRPTPANTNAKPKKRTGPRRAEALRVVVDNYKESPDLFEERDSSAGSGLHGERINIGPPSIPAGWRPDADVPATRADCIGMQRPCTHVRCRHHLWVLVGVDRPGRPWFGRRPPPIIKPTSNHSCSLDIADQYPDGLPLGGIAAVLGMTRRRASMILDSALAKIAAAGGLEGLNAGTAYPLAAEGTRRVGGSRT